MKEEKTFPEYGANIHQLANHAARKLTMPSQKLEKRVWNRVKNRVLGTSDTVFMACYVGSVGYKLLKMGISEYISKKDPPQKTSRRRNILNF